MKPAHVINTSQFFDRAILERLFVEAAKMKAGDYNPQALHGKIIATLFYEPSTRTRLSFESAIMKLGGNVISTEAAGQFSSAIKGESLEDSIKVIGGYADLIVLRHPEVGSAERAAKVSRVPVVNAGDGGGEHPTQALLDALTIQQERGTIDGLKVALVGDLNHSRSMHSLVFLLGLYKVEFLLVAPDQLQLPAQYLQYLKKKRLKYTIVENLNALDKTIDIVYMNRIQKERFEDPNEYEHIKDYFVFKRSRLSQLKPEARIMDPLPRVGKIDPSVDRDPRAAYFRQAENGLYARMALLAHLLK
jgi:aspartate carbamoyltransferase catalytic subunit